jgi:hypothetical protein
MGALIPLGDELMDSALKGGEIGEVGGPQALAAQDAEPLFDRIPPGPVDGREVGDEARVGGQPGLDLLAVMDRNIVGEQMDRGQRGREGAVEMLQEAELLHLALAARGPAIVLPRARVEGGE